MGKCLAQQCYYLSTPKMVDLAHLKSKERNYDVQQIPPEFGVFTPDEFPTSLSDWPRECPTFRS